MNRKIESEVFLKQDIAAILRALALANNEESPGFYRALVAVATALGLEDLAHDFSKVVAIR